MTQIETAAARLAYARQIGAKVTLVFPSLFEVEADAPEVQAYVLKYLQGVADGVCELLLREAEARGVYPCHDCGTLTDVKDRRRSPTPMCLRCQRGDLTCRRIVVMFNRAFGFPVVSVN